jgi:LysR family carnitine catabolism transcriptional activator
VPALAAGLLPTSIGELASAMPERGHQRTGPLGNQVDDLVSERHADIGFSVCPAVSDTIHLEPLIDDHCVAECPQEHPLLASEKSALADGLMG